MSLWGEWWVEIALIAQTAILQTKKSKVINLALVIWWDNHNKIKTITI